MVLTQHIGIVETRRTMNEVQLIRAQLATEKKHAAEVAQACASVLATMDSQQRDDERLGPLVEYLVWILTRFEEREQVFHALLRSRFAADDANRRAVEDALALPGTSREALANLETAVDATTDRSTRWTDFAKFFSGPWSARREELDRLFEKQAKVTDWRAVSGIDADSIFDERSRYARVQAVRA
jgi:hypothetical protein